MKLLILWTGLLTGTLATGCGGGEGHGGSGVAVLSATYSFVAPAMNSRRVYALTTLDNANNTINQVVRDTVTAVNADGSYSFVRDDPTDTSLTVNGANYTILTQAITKNNSGQLLAVVTTPANGIPVGCTYSPNGPGPVYPVTVGQVWTTTGAAACLPGTSSSFFETGSVVDVESVTVPAGTFSTVKFQGTLVSTDSNGTIRTQSSIVWRDVITEILVKESDTIEYSGTPLAAGHPVSQSLVLQSRT